MNIDTLLAANGYVRIQTISDKNDPAVREMFLGTVFSNFAFYGFIPSETVVRSLISLSTTDLASFWGNVEPALKEITGASRNIGDFVVYKNFPREVLNMSRARYWFNQILMYWGMPNEYFTTEANNRPELKEKIALKVLDVGTDDTIKNIYETLVNLPVRWTDPQKEQALFLFSYMHVPSADVNAFGFKENGIRIAVEAVNNSLPVSINTATDVLRLAVGMSDGDISLRSKSTFEDVHEIIRGRNRWDVTRKVVGKTYKHASGVGTRIDKFKRGTRKFLLNILENCPNLVEDFYLRRGEWKRLLHQLRPGDYKFPRVSEAYDLLYRDAYNTYASVVENGIQSKNIEVLNVLRTRPGDFLRRLHKAYSVFGMSAVESFISVLPKLTVIQLLKLDNYLLTINNRETIIIAPKGNWTRAQIRQNTKAAINPDHLRHLHTAISAEISTRLAESFPAGFNVDLNVDKVKLQTNDQKLAPYGRGTVFDIPENMTFLRFASFWKVQSKSKGSVWFDNGVNFLDDNMNPVGSCCWNCERFPVSGSRWSYRNTQISEDTAAVFSGDPTNWKDREGRACQMIDLYIDKLAKNNVRYAVWNILSYSFIKFDDADDVVGIVQWGEDANAGELFEPSRAQMVFPIKGQNLTKYLVCIDVKERKVIYLDANLYGNVRSASENGPHLKEKLPAFFEYMKSLPSIADLFTHGKEGTTPILYSDAGTAINGGDAYVFVRQNAENAFNPIDIGKI